MYAPACAQVKKTPVSCGCCTRQLLFSVARLRSVYRRVNSIELATRCKQLHLVSWLYNNPRSNLRGSKIQGEEKVLGNKSCHNHNGLNAVPGDSRPSCPSSHSLHTPPHPQQSTYPSTHPSTPSHSTDPSTTHTTPHTTA